MLESPDQYFDRLPIEFKRHWLPARVEHSLWPPTVKPDSWRRVLGDEPERWRLYNWREETINITAATWRPDVVRTIEGLKAAFFDGAVNEWTNLGTQDKIPKIQNYAMKNGVLPSKLLVAQTPSGLFLVDGYHRVTWFTFMRSMLGTALPVSPIANCYFGRFDEI